MAINDISDLLNDYGMEETQPLGSGVTPIKPIDPNEALLAKLNKYVDEITGRATEDTIAQKKRTKKLEEEINKSPREREKELIPQLFKDKYGFTPDSVPKKIAANFLNVLSGALGGVAGKDVSIYSKAKEMGQKDYDEKTKGYKDLLSQELNAQKEANRNSQLDIVNNIKQIQMAQQNNQFNKKMDWDKQKFEREQQFKEDIGWSNYDIKQQHEEAYQLFNTAQTALAKTKNEDLKTKIEGQKELQKLSEQTGMPVSWLEKNANQYTFATWLASGGVDRTKGGNIMDVLQDMANLKQSQGGGSVTIPGVIKTDPSGNQIQGPTVRQKIEGPAYQRKTFLPDPSTSEALKQKVLGSTRNPYDEIVNPAPQAKRIAQAVTTPGAITPPSPIAETGNPVEDGKNIWDAAKKVPRFGGLQGSGPGAAVYQRDQVKKIREWEDTNNLLRQNMDVMGEAIASGKGDFRNAVSQNPIMKKIRTALGSLTGTEITTDVNSLFAVAAHLKSRFQSSRPAVQLVTAIEGAVNNHLDNAETFYKRQAAVSMLSELSKTTMENPLYEKALTKFQEAGGTGDSTPSWVKAVNTVIDRSYNSAKKGKYVRPTLDQVIDEIYNGHKKSKSASGGSAPFNGTYDEWSKKHSGTKYLEDDNQEDF